LATSLGEPANQNISSEQPVEVTLSEISQFLKKLNEKSVGEEFRLITKAEWKDACREGGKNSLW
tara:strand:- start:4 stop:195 length:192 start_codon:yes stop_codon:yes gene_type:complete